MSAPTIDWQAQLRARFAPPAEVKRRQWATPGELARAIDPDTIQTEALALIDQALVDVDAGRCDRLMIFMPPQEGKSTRVTKTGPAWMLTRNPSRRIAVVSYGAELADDFGGAIRSIITENSGQDGTLDLGLRIAPDNGAVSRWRLAGHRGGVRSIGIKGGLTGRPADMLFIDDPVSNRDQAESAAWRLVAKRFWTSVASTRLAPGAPVIIVLTRWHEDDLAGWLLQRPDKDRWRVINIPAQANHDPNKGETDPLGRAPGEYLRSARTNEWTGQTRTDHEWEQIKVQAGALDWNALYQGNPTPPEGGLFRRDAWRRYDVAPWVEREDGSRWVPGVPVGGSEFTEIIQSWDMTFKDTDGSDYVVGQVWLRRGIDCYLLDQVRARMDFVATCAAFRLLTARWPQALLKIVEDKANGPAVIAALSREVMGIVPEEPQGSKVARARAVTPLVQAGNVHLPEASLVGPWVEELVEEHAAFPNGTHDDTVDTLSQALHRLVLVPLAAGDDSILTQDEVEADEDDHSYLASW